MISSTGSSTISANGSGAFGGVGLTGRLAVGRLAGFRLLVLAIEVFLTNVFRAFVDSR